jgi:hypothetical protein
VTKAATLALAAALAVAGARDGRAATVDFLHVEANSGGSSGGHVALRLGDRVFDYQHRAGGTLTLRRSRWEVFRHRTTVLGNRTIRVARVEVGEADFARLRDAFEERHLVWSRHYARLEAARADERLLARLQAGEPPAAVEGAGLFAPRAGGAGSEALRELRARVARRHGPELLASRLRAFEARLAALAPAAEVAAPPAVDPARLPRAPYPFSAQARDLAQWIVALRALIEAAPLAESALRPAGADAFRLDEAETRGLAAWARDLERSLAALAASERPDGGLALLVGMARLEAVRRSLAEGRLRLLEDLPRDAEALPPGARNAHDPYLTARRADAAERFVRARRRLAAPEPLRELDYDALEEAGNDLIEADRTLSGAAPWRLHEGERIPAPAAVVDGLPSPALDEAAAQAALAAARRRTRTLETALHEAFAYELLTRNCVTELFATIAEALGAGATALGGPAPPPGPLRFVPFAAYEAVQRSWRVAERWEEPAWRRARLADLYAEENDLRVFLRESNTWTSTVHRHDPDEARFLFFTDDAPPLRPLLGAANLLAGLGQAAVGVALLPLDRGEALRDGLVSAVYSLPELAFVSLRKGTLRYGPPPAREEAFGPAP